MVLAILAVVAVATLLAWFWAHILEFLRGTVQTTVRTYFGVEAESSFSNFLVWLDKGATSVHRVLKNMVKFIKNQVLRMESNYEKLGANSYKKTESAYINLGNGKCIRRTSEEEVSYDQLPAEVRAEMIRQNTREAKLDEKALTIEKTKERLAEEGFEEELQILTA